MTSRCSNASGAAHMEHCGGFSALKEVRVCRMCVTHQQPEDDQFNPMR
jgi:hypothetical protein